MSWYEFLLFFHIGMAVIWVGGTVMMHLFGMRALATRDTARLATLGKDIEWIATRTFTPASLLAFVSGILLVIESDFYGFGDDWIVIGLVLYAATFLAGVLYLGPESGRVGKLMAAGSPEAGRRMQRLIILSRLDVVLLWLILYDMAVKPELGDASSILWGLAGALLAAGLVLWRYRVALAQGPPAAATDSVS
jgi:uncharacterized membrane protein